MREAKPHGQKKERVMEAQFPHTAVVEITGARWNQAATLPVTRCRESEQRILGLGFAGDWRGWSERTEPVQPNQFEWV
jgi:hypothetical protein